MTRRCIGSVVAAAMLAGCFESSVAAPDGALPDGGDGPSRDGSGPLDARVPPPPPPPPTRDVDLLLVVDDSNSMTEEQHSLMAELDAMIGILTSGDVDGDGSLDGEIVQRLAN